MAMSKRDVNDGCGTAGSWSVPVSDVAALHSTTPLSIAQPNSPHSTHTLKNTHIDDTDLIS